MILCDRPRCQATFSENRRPYIPVSDLLLLAESAGWQIEPLIAPLRHFCPGHHVTEQDMAKPCAAGIRRAG